MRDSPLTNLRSLSSSLGFHAILFLIVSIVAVRFASPSQPAAPTIIHGEIGPVDNRADVASEGGGPGEMGGVGPPEGLRIIAIPSLGQSQIDALADAPRASIPSAGYTPDDIVRELPGLPLSGGAGILPGPGLGGGGGSGGGSGGGEGRGVGPTTAFFGAREQARSFAYVIDRSGSMSERNALQVAKTELIASLGQLPPDAEFAVIFYNLEPTPITDARGRANLLPATAANKLLVQERLRSISAQGGTDHARALRAGFALRPEVIFFLTDGLQLTREAAEVLRQEAGAIRVHVIEFGAGPDSGTSHPLKGLALTTGGSYRYIDVQRDVK